YAKSRATPKFFALKLRKTERQQFFSPQTSTNPPHNNIFRPKHQRIRATLNFFAPNFNKSAPQQKFSRQPPANPPHSKVFRATHPICPEACEIKIGCDVET